MVAFAVGGCYDPRITDGQFTCAVSRICPVGFSCVDGRCRAAGLDLASALTALPDLAPPDLALSDPATSDLAMPDFVRGVDMDSSDLWQAGLGDLDLSQDSGTVEIDTDSGTIELLGNRVIVPAGSVGFRTVTDATAVNAGIFSFRRVVIPAAITVRPRASSKSALVLAASQTIAIDGTLDWQGRGALGGARTTAGNPGSASVGGGGGGAAADGSGSGGGGGGYASVGSAGQGNSGGAGGNGYGSALVVPLHVGAGGGGGGGVEPGGVGGVGGSGGGAVALLTLGALTLRGTLSVAGNDGRPGAGAEATAPAGGGGGGSGGSLVLAADTLLLDAGHALSALGGAGGAAKASGGVGGAGSPGRIWLGYGTISVAGGTANSMPEEVRAPNGKVSVFPR
jgi:hypothetical protein